MLAARLEVVGAAARGLAASAEQAGLRLVVDPDGPAVEKGALVEAFREAADGVSIRLDGSLLDVRRRAESLIAIAGTAAACRLPVPSAAIPDAERLADALDIVEGVGIDRVTLETNPAWVAIGVEALARAASRLRGRAGRSGLSPARRRELNAG